MAGGDSTLKNAPYPKTPDGLVLLEFGPTNIIASQTDKIFDAMTLRFPCQVMAAEVTSWAVAETNAISVNLQDDSSTPKEAITNQGLATLTAGAGTILSCTVDRTKKFNAGAILQASYISGVSDTSIGTKLRVWVKPTA